MELQQNPLMQKLKLPGRIFQLPSRAALYKNGEVDAKEGEVEVLPMSALTEISLKNPDHLFSGKAITQVFGECIPSIKKPTELYGRDIDAIMYYLRLVTYGPQFEINVKHDCAEAKNHSYLVNIEEMVQQMRFLDPTVAEKEFTTTLPNGQVVKVHPIKFDHMIKLFQMNANKEQFTDEDVKANVVFNLVELIDSVDGITDKGLIKEWVGGLTTPFQNRITQAIERTNDWGPQQTTKLKCKDCGAEIDVEMPLNPISFFTE
jgi:hypothetical protein